MILTSTELNNFRLLFSIKNKKIWSCKPPVPLVDWKTCPLHEILTRLVTTENAWQRLFSSTVHSQFKKDFGSEPNLSSRLMTPKSNQIIFQWMTAKGLTGMYYNLRVNSADFLFFKNQPNVRLSGYGIFFIIWFLAVASLNYHLVKIKDDPISIFRNHL